MITLFPVFKSQKVILVKDINNVINKEIAKKEGKEYDLYMLITKYKELGIFTKSVVIEKAWVHFHKTNKKYLLDSEQKQVLINELNEQKIIF